MRCYLGAIVLLAWPATAIAFPDKAPPNHSPERLLPADTLAYLRYDGFEPHRRAYEKTTLAKVMKDDLGEFLEYMANFIRDTIVRQMVAKGDAAQELGDLQKSIAATNKFMDYYWRHGIAAGIEVRGNPSTNPRFQVTLVFPQGGAKENREHLFAFMNMLTTLANTKVKKTEQGRRLLYQFWLGEYRGAWWQEGDHVVVTFGTEALSRCLDVIDGGRPNLADTPVYKAVAGFKRYETDIRGFINVQKLVGLLRGPGETSSLFERLKETLARQLIISQLGLNGLKNLTFFAGFDRQYQRSTIILDVPLPRERAGLLRLVSAGVHFDPKHLPPLPPDAASVSVRHADWDQVYQVVRQTYQQLAFAASLGNTELPRFPDLDQILGIDFRKDFLASLDTTLVSYNALSEGPYFLGQGLAIKVKNADKLQASLEAINKALSAALGDDRLSFGKQKYRGAYMHVFSGPAMFPIPVTYTIHKGWWVIGVFPQSVKGYILRCEGRHRVWKVPPLTKEVLALAKKEAGPNSKLAAITVTDPKPTVEFGLSMLPVLMQFIFASAGLEESFDVSKIPNAQAITESLFPHVTVFYDDGDALRWESHFSIDVPDVGGIFLFYVFYEYFF